MGKYKTKNPVEIEAIQYRLQEYADNPLTFDEVPTWLMYAIDAKQIRPIFLTEDYWYLDIDVRDEVLRCAPDDYIVKDDRGNIYPLTSEKFKELYEKIN